MHDRVREHAARSRRSGRPRRARRRSARSSSTFESAGPGVDVSNAIAVSDAPNTSAAHAAPSMTRGSTSPGQRSGSAIFRKPPSAAAPGPTQRAGSTRCVCTSITGRVAAERGVGRFEVVESRGRAPRRSRRRARRRSPAGSPRCRGDRRRSRRPTARARRRRASMSASAACARRAGRRRSTEAARTRRSTAVGAAAARRARMTPTVPWPPGRGAGTRSGPAASTLASRSTRVASRRLEWPEQARRRSHAHRIVGDVAVVDPVGGGHGRQQADVRDRRHALRRSAARRDRGSRRVARLRSRSGSRTGSRRGSTSRAARSSTPATAAGA